MAAPPANALSREGRLASGLETILVGDFHHLPVEALRLHTFRMANTAEARFKLFLWHDTQTPSGASQRVRCGGIQDLQDGDMCNRMTSTVSEHFDGTAPSTVKN
jgi:hypothetical protein